MIVAYHDNNLSGACEADLRSSSPPINHCLISMLFTIRDLKHVYIDRFEFVYEIERHILSLRHDET